VHAFHHFSVKVLYRVGEGWDKEAHAKPEEEEEDFSPEDWDVDF
jgi:hypothetical protein